MAKLGTPVARWHKDRPDGGAVDFALKTDGWLVRKMTYCSESLGRWSEGWKRYRVAPSMEKVREAMIAGGFEEVAA
jgi:uncharacterized protein HemY